MRNTTLFFLSILLILISLRPYPVQAQTPHDGISSGIATYISVNGTTEAGDIIKLGKNGYELSTDPYDPSIFGIITDNPSVSFENTTVKGTQPVISTGKVYVRVITANGPIHKGDLITASKIPGVGEKAIQQGYVIGTAAQDYTASNKTSVGKILVVLNITFSATTGEVKNNLLASFQNVLNAPYLSPLNAMRYVLAAVLVVLSFIIAVGFFGKVSQVGVEAIGRNPLAGKLILLSVVFHLVLAATIILVGVGIAYLILII